MHLRALATGLFAISISAVALASPPSTPAAKRIPVEVWIGGDDGLTLRLRDTLERAIESSSLFTLSNGRRAGSLIITIPDHVKWKRIGGRTHIYYTADFKLRNSRKVGVDAGDCWDDELTNCVNHIMREAESAVHKAGR